MKKRKFFIIISFIVVVFLSIGIYMYIDYHNKIRINKNYKYDETDIIIVYGQNSDNSTLYARKKNNIIGGGSIYAVDRKGVVNKILDIYDYSIIDVSIDKGHMYVLCYENSISEEALTPSILEVDLSNIESCNMKVYDADKYFINYNRAELIDRDDIIVKENIASNVVSENNKKYYFDGSSLICLENGKYNIISTLENNAEYKEIYKTNNFIYAICSNAIGTRVVEEVIGIDITDDKQESLYSTDDYISGMEIDGNMYIVLSDEILKISQEGMVGSILSIEESEAYMFRGISDRNGIFILKEKIESSESTECSILEIDVNGNILKEYELGIYVDKIIR